MATPNLKPLPKEKTPPLIKIRPREKEIKEDLPESPEINEVKENEFLEEEHHSEELHEEIHEETHEEVKEEPAEKTDTPPKTSDEEIANILKNSDEGEKPDASAIADAIIMSHNAKTKQSSKNGVKTICAMLLGIIALAVLLLSGVLNPKSNDSGGDSGQTPSDDTLKPSIKKAAAVCEKHENYIFKESNLYGVELEGYEDHIKQQGICMYNDEISERPDNTFEFTYTRLSDFFDEIDGFRDHLKTVAAAYDNLEDSTNFYKSFMPSSTYYYISAYRKALVTLSASDTDTAEELLKDLHFPDRSHATED